MAGPLTAELSARAVIAPGIAELAFTMRSPGRLMFRAGQFVSLALPSPSDETAGIDPRRSYSIASQSSAGELLRFFIRVIPEGKASDYLMALPLGNHRQPDRTTRLLRARPGSRGRRRLRGHGNRHRRGDADAG